MSKNSLVIFLFFVFWAISPVSAYYITFVPATDTGTKLQISVGNTGETVMRNITIIPHVPVSIHSPTMNYLTFHRNVLERNQSWEIELPLQFPNRTEDIYFSTQVLSDGNEPVTVNIKVPGKFLFVPLDLFSFGSAAGLIFAGMAIATLFYRFKEKRKKE